MLKERPSLAGPLIRIGHHDQRIPYLFLTTLPARCSYVL
jgi:hypothetical protein